MSINDLFAQIIQSEERIRERFSKLREVNKEIQEYQVKYQDLTDELKSLQGLLVLKSQCLAEEELNLKWFTIQEHVSTEKRKELSGRNAHLFQLKERKGQTIDDEIEEFKMDVVKFIALFDLCGRGREKRITEATKQMEEVRRKEQRMKKDMATLMETQEQITSLLEEKNGLSVNNSQMECKFTALKAQLQNATNQTLCLQNDKKKAAVKPQRDPEFIRLSDQLDDTKNNTMEGICEALADELKEVQQIHLKIQLKKRKQQQQGRHQPKANQVQNQSAERRWREQLNRQLCQTSIKE
ncbi:coiled-coil domain-containing protein 172-like isoform X1 [Oculina patagonica]